MRAFSSQCDFLINQTAGTVTGSSNDMLNSFLLTSLSLSLSLHNHSNHSEFWSQQTLMWRMWRPLSWQPRHPLNSFSRYKANSFHSLDVCGGKNYHRFQISNDDCSCWLCANTRVLFAGSLLIVQANSACCFFFSAAMMAVIMAVMAEGAKIRWWHIGHFSEAEGPCCLQQRLWLANRLKLHLIAGILSVKQTEEHKEQKCNEKEKLAMVDIFIYPLFFPESLVCRK